MEIVDGSAWRAGKPPTTRRLLAPILSSRGLVLRAELLYLQRMSARETQVPWEVTHTFPSREGNGRISCGIPLIYQRTGAYRHRARLRRIRSSR